jgi:hypothetical protein
VIPPEGDGGDELLASLTDTQLYSIGAYFADRHPDLIDDVIAQSGDIEEAGLLAYAEAEGITPDVAFQTLITGLAVRYYKAVAGGR